MLTQRAQSILKYMVGRYIVQGIPVPSQYIARECNLGVSPATIRNEMARLEEEGYISRRYASGGSIPSDKGYRYYVESLGTIELSSTEQRLISHLFHQVEKELEKWLSLAATITAQFAHNVAVVTVPKTADCRFKHLELVALQDSLSLVVLVLYGARIKRQLNIFDTVIVQSELTAMANKLNATYSGLTGQQISAKRIVLTSAEQKLTDCLVKMMQAEDEQDWEQPYLDGLHFMFGQPEFAHSQKIQALMEMIEQRRLLKFIVPPSLSSGKVQVIIGKENTAEAMQNCSLVCSRYGLPDEAVGTIGVIGPTRMPYANVISAVKYLALVLSALVAGLYGRDTFTHLNQPDVN